MWSREVGALAGVELPVEGEARSMWFTPQDGGLPERLPLTIDFSTGFYVHREGPGLAFGGRERALEDVAEAAARRLPVLAELPVQSSWWGWYDVSPDWNALVGEAPHVSRFLYATGFSGHGFQQAPAVGEHLAELVVGREPTLDSLGVLGRAFAAGGAPAAREAFVVYRGRRANSASARASGAGRTCRRRGIGPTSTRRAVLPRRVHARRVERRERLRLGDRAAELVRDEPDRLQAVALDLRLVAVAEDVVRLVRDDGERHHDVPTCEQSAATHERGSQRAGAWRNQARYVHSAGRMRK